MFFVDYKKRWKKKIYLRKEEIEEIKDEKISSFLRGEKIIILTESEIKKRELAIKKNFKGRERRGVMRLFFSRLYDVSIKKKRINIPRKMLKKP